MPVQETKTFVLLDSTRPSAPIFNIVGDKRIKINAIPKWRPFLQYTFTNEEGVNVTTRLKLNSNTIFQDKQIKDENIPANAKFTSAERNVGKFTNGALVVKNPIVIKFLLEGCAHIKGFKGITAEPIAPMFEVYDKEVEIKNQNKLTRATIKVANAIMSLEEDEAKELLIRVNGVGFTPPEDLDEAQNLLIDYMDSSEEAVADLERKLSKVDGKKQTVTLEDVNAIVGMLVSNGIVNFEHKPNEVSKKYGNGFQKLRDISSTEYDFDQRVALFCEFLLTDDGKEMRLSLEKEVTKLNNK